MIKHIYLILIVFLNNWAWADETYAYLGFWHHHTASSASTHILTTAENASAEHAKQQWQDFCAKFSQTQPAQQSICFGETFLHNQCAAAAYDSAKGLPSPTNIFIVKGKNFAQVQIDAQNQCVQAAGENAICEVETAFCSDRNLYETD